MTGVLIPALTGRPYNFRTYNCWHHVRYARAAYGLPTPEFDVTSPADIPAAFARGHENPQFLEKVSQPQDLDVVLLGYVSAGRVVWHAGVFYQGYVSHCARQEKQVKLESIEDLSLIYPRLEFWR